MATGVSHHSLLQAKLGPCVFFLESLHVPCSAEKESRFVKLGEMSQVPGLHSHSKRQKIGGLPEKAK